LQEKPKEFTQEEIKKQQLDRIQKLNFARMSKTVVQDLKDNRKESVIFRKYPKEKVVEFLAKPQQCEKQIRDMSIFLYVNSSQYRRLCNYFAKIPLFNYYVSPYNLDKNKFNKKSFVLNYKKVLNLLERINMKSQASKIFNICFSQDTFYGLYFETEDSFDIVPVNSDYCQISSKIDGCLVYSLDFSYFDTRKYLLESYGEPLKTMYYNYAGWPVQNSNTKVSSKQGNSNLRWQEPPNQICIKVNEEQLLYSFPPFAAIFPDILNLEDYKLISKTGEMLDRYKLISLQIPIDDSGNFQLDSEVCDKYYNLVCNNVSDNIGVVQTPLKLDSISFQNTAAKENNAVNDAEKELFTSAGSSINLFGGENTSSSSLLLSIKNDEAISFTLLRQIENWLNKYIKNLDLPYDFKVHYLNQSIYNQDDVCKRYKEAATYGVAGSRSMYAASLDMSPSDVLSMQQLEDNLDFAKDWVPLQSSNTMSNTDNGNNGRPTNKEKGKPLKESGQSTQDNDSNDNR
jgi:hypothetical protein